jgi:hypothetical protein
VFDHLQIPGSTFTYDSLYKEISANVVILDRSSLDIAKSLLHTYFKKVEFHEPSLRRIVFLSDSLNLFFDDGNAINLPQSLSMTEPRFYLSADIQRFIFDYPMFSTDAMHGFDCIIPLPTDATPVTFQFIGPWSENSIRMGDRIHLLMEDGNLDNIDVSSLNILQQWLYFNGELIGINRLHVDLCISDIESGTGSCDSYLPLFDIKDYAEAEGYHRSNPFRVVIMGPNVAKTLDFSSIPIDKVSHIIVFNHNREENAPPVAFYHKSTAIEATITLEHVNMIITGIDHHSFNELSLKSPRDRWIY